MKDIKKSVNEIAKTITREDIEEAIKCFENDDYTITLEDTYNLFKNQKGIRLGKDIELRIKTDVE